MASRRRFGIKEEEGIYVKEWVIEDWDNQVIP